MVRVAPSVIGIVLVVLLVAGCSPGAGIADRIRATDAGLLQDVSFRASVTGSGTVMVHLIPGTTQAEAHKFWCDVVVPAAGSDLSNVAILIESTDPPGSGMNPLLADGRVVCPP